MKRLLAYFGYYQLNEHASTYTFWIKEKDKWVMYVVMNCSVKKVVNNCKIIDLQPSEMTHFGIRLNDIQILESYNNGIPKNPKHHSALIGWRKMGDNNILKF